MLGIAHTRLLLRLRQVNRPHQDPVVVIRGGRSKMHDNKCRQARAASVSLSSVLTDGSVGGLVAGND
jgi:hypothetical protein